MKYTLLSHAVQFNILGKGSSFTYAWAANIANEWLPMREIHMLQYLQIESENQKSNLIIFLVLIHSASIEMSRYLRDFNKKQTLFTHT